MATNNFAGHEPAPFSPAYIHHKLVAPYIVGTGHEFGNVTLFYEGQVVHPGSIIKTDKDDMLRVIDVRLLEDFFDDLNIITCSVVTNNPADTVDSTAREFYYQFSAYGG